MSVGNKLSIGEILRHFFLFLIPSLVESSYRSVALTYRSASVAFIANSNMLFSLLSGWNNPPPKAIDDSDNQSENMNPNTHQKSRPSVEKPLLKPGVHPIVSEQLKLSVDLFRGRLKHRDAAILIMRFLIKSDVRLSEPSSSFSCQNYLQFLDKLELLDLNTASFGAKHVLSVEGLEFSGKSTLINNIHKRVSKKVRLINRQELPDVIQHHSETACIAWEFLENYRIAMEILDGDDEVVLVEDYYHYFQTKYLRKFVEQEEEVNNIPYPSFAWPFDLPMPELVLFLTTSPDTRIERKQDGELSSGPKTIVPGAAAMSEPVQDAIANVSSVLANTIHRQLLTASTSQYRLSSQRFVALVQSALIHRLPQCPCMPQFWRPWSTSGFTASPET